jgi:hypothetical protein
MYLHIPISSSLIFLRLFPCSDGVGVCRRPLNQLEGDRSEANWFWLNKIFRVDALRTQPSLLMYLD